MKTLSLFLFLFPFCLYAQNQVFKSIDSLFHAQLDTLDSTATLGISVFSLHENKSLLNDRADSLFTPASTLKLITTSSAFHNLPIDYFPETWLQLWGSITGKTFYGVVKIVGKGDPNLSGRYFPNALIPIQVWVDSLKANGIDSVVGKIEIDTSYFADPRRPSTWKPDFFNYWYGAEVSALGFNDNCLLVRVQPGEKKGDSVQTQILPELNALHIINNATTSSRRRNRLKWILTEKGDTLRLEGTLGIKNKGTARSIPIKAPGHLLPIALQTTADSLGFSIQIDSSIKSTGRDLISEFHFKTVPLLSILSEINQRSQNLHAETILRQNAFFRTGKASLENGLHVEKIFLDSLQIDTTGLILLDGSGLSAGNKIRPSTETQLLSKMLRHPHSDLFFSTLGIPGISASGKRLSHILAPHRSRFKTGYIDGVQGLAGTIAASNGDTLTIALYLNNTSLAVHTAREFLDSIWSAINTQANMEFNSLKEARKLWNKHKTETNFLKRMDLFSKSLLGKPYFLGPTGEGFMGKIEAKPLLSTQHFDCVTYIETALSLARSKTQKDILNQAIKVRYLNGTVNYQHRKHYFVEDWILGSPNIVFPYRFKGDTTATRETGKIKFFQSKHINWNHENPKTKLHYVPFDKMVSLLQNWDTSKNLFLGIGFVGKIPSLWVTHTGFFIARPGEKPRLRHASSRHKKAAEEDFLQYLLTRKKSIIGVTFFEFKEP